MADPVSVVGSTLASVVELLAILISQCSKYSQNAKHAKHAQDIERVMEQIANWTAVAEKLLDLLDGPHGLSLQTSQELHGALEDGYRQFERLCDKLVMPYLRPSKMTIFGSRALKWPFDSKEIEQILQDLARCMQSITTTLQLGQTVTLLLSRLPEAAGAAFDSHAEENNPKCLYNTRVDFFYKIDKWMKDPAAETIFWLNGMPGTGKSTISRTLAHVAKFFTTITAQLIRQEPALAVYVQEAIDADLAICQTTMPPQFKRLFLGPLLKLQHAGTIVIIIDALDECAIEEDVNFLIRLLSSATLFGSSRLRIFLTSRPELPIRFNLGAYQDRILHHIEQSSTEHDLSAYFDYNLAKIRIKYNDSIPQHRQLPLTWPEQSDIQTLVEMASPSFIAAARICSFVADRRIGTPENNLQAILRDPRVVSASDSSFRGFQGREKLDHIFDFQSTDDFQLKTMPQQVAASTMSMVDKGVFSSTSQTNETRSTTMEEIFDAETLSQSTRLTTSLHTSFGLAETSLEKLPPIAEQDDNYSDAGSIADYEEAYVNILRNELLQDVDSIGLMNVEAELSPLLEEFAIRIGYQGETKEHQNMMYATHKYRRRIASEAYRVQMELQGDHDMDESAGSAGSAGSERMAINHGAYYSNAKIEDWQHQTEDCDDSGSLVDDDPIETTLGLDRNALRESEAYKWLVSSIKRESAMNGVNPISMKRHRKWMLNILETNTPWEQMIEQRKISRNRRPATYTARFELSWNLVNFLRSQNYESEQLHEVVGKVITVSGDQYCAQALPCKEYMEQIWPCTGAAMEELLEIIVKAPGQRRECVLPDSTHIWAQLLEDCVLLEATGSKYGLAEMTEQLFWVSTALQTPTFDPGLSLNSVKAAARFTPDTKFHPNLQHHIPRSVHVGTAHCKVQFESMVPNKSLQRSEGDCWHNLFGHCAVVSGYPIPSRPSRRPGLEIQLGMMAGLSCAERITAFGNDIILKGYSTLISLVHHEDGCMFWHMVYNEDGSQISFADHRVFETGANGLALLGNVDDTRHFLGWAPEVKKTIGAIDAKYDIRWSALRAPARGFALEKVQISAGKYVTAGGTFAVGKRDKAVHIKDRDDYLVRLRSLGEQFVVLLDVEAHKAWLVDGLSALLHLTRANLVHEHNHSDYKLASLCSPDALKARPGDSGRNVAFNTLCDAVNQKLRLHRKDGTLHEKGDTEVSDDDFYCLVDAIKYIMHLLEQIIAHQADERTESSVGYRIKLSPWSQLEGFDFMDIATKSDPIWPRATMLRNDGKAWVELTRAVRATTLFGKGFGELVQPNALAEGQQSCDTCYWNINMPADRDLLAVPMSELERIVERRGQKLGACWRLVDDLYLQLVPELFSDCSGGGGRVCCRRPRLQRIRRGTSDAVHMSQEKDRSRLHKFSSRLFHRHDDRTLLADKDIASVDFPMGSVLLGDMPRNRQVTKWTRKDILKRFSLWSVAASGPTSDTTSAANVSPLVSTINTTEDTDSTIKTTNLSTQLTLPSNSRPPFTPTTDECGSQTGGSSDPLHREYGQVPSKQLSPNNVALYPKIITAITESGDHTEREASYQETSQLNSRTAPVSFNTHDVALQQGDEPEGIGRNNRVRAPVLSTTVPTPVANSQTQELHISKDAGEPDQ